MDGEDIIEIEMNYNSNEAFQERTEMLSLMLRV